MRFKAVLGCLLVVVPAIALGQSAGGSADPVAVELAKVNATLTEIAGLLKKEVEAQDLDLVMKRVQLSEARLADSERNLKNAESERRSSEGERGQLEARLKMITVEVEHGQGEGAAAQAEALTTQVEGDLKRVKQRIGELTTEIGDLESTVTTRRDELRSWQAVLDRRLSNH